MNPILLKQAKAPLCYCCYSHKLEQYYWSAWINRNKAAPRSLISSIFMIFPLVFLALVLCLGIATTTEGSIMGRRATYLKKTYPDFVFRKRIQIEQDPSATKSILLFPRPSNSFGFLVALSPSLYDWVAESRTDSFELISLTQDDYPPILLVFNSVTLIETVDDEGCVIKIPPSVASDLQSMNFLVEGKSPGVAMRRAIDLEVLDNPEMWPAQLTEVLTFFPHFYENGEQTFNYLVHFLMEILRAAEHVKSIPKSIIDRCLAVIKVAAQRDPSLGVIAEAFIKRLANEEIVFEDLLPLLQSKTPSAPDFGSYLLINDHNLLSSLTDEQLELLVIEGSLEMSVLEAILKESRLKSVPVLLLIATQAITSNDVHSPNVFSQCVTVAKSLNMLPALYRHAIPLVNLLPFTHESDMELTEESLCHATFFWKIMIQEDSKLFVKVISSMKAKDIPKGFLQTIKQSTPLVQLLNGSINSMGIIPFLMRISTFTENEAKEALYFAEFCLYLWNYALQSPNLDTVLTGVATIVSALISRLDADDQGDFEVKLTRIVELGLYRCLAIWFQQQRPMIKPEAIAASLTTVISTGIAPNMITQCLLLRYYGKPSGYKIGESWDLNSLITSVAHQFPTRPITLTPMVKTTLFITFFHSMDTTDGQLPRELLLGLYRASTFFIFGIPFAATLISRDISDDDLIQFWISEYLSLEGITDSNLTVCPRWVKSQNRYSPPLSIVISASS